MLLYLLQVLLVYMLRKVFEALPCYKTKDMVSNKTAVSKVWALYRLWINLISYMFSWYFLKFSVVEIISTYEKMKFIFSCVSAWIDTSVWCVMGGIELLCDWVKSLSFVRDSVKSLLFVRDSVKSLLFVRERVKLLLFWRDYLKYLKMPIIDAFL